MSWVYVPQHSHFSIANIPFGVISTAVHRTPRPAVAIGNRALDLKIFAENEGFQGLRSIHQNLHVFHETSLNAFAALGQNVHEEVRKYLQDVLAADTRHPEVLKENELLQKQALIPLSDITLHLPMKIGNYTDFYAGKHHAYNCGCIFRGPNNALQPNYTHMPVAYHSRPSSVVVSGTPIRRPLGQILENPMAEHKVPILSASKRLDIELELGAFVCKDSSLGEPIPVDQAHEYIFGFVLLNDWSARDLQSWESAPLGPFLSKNFGTSISPWVVLPRAIPQSSRCANLKNETVLLPYLEETQKHSGYDIKLSVDIITSRGSSSTVTSTSSKNLLFSFPQMLAHHTISGCNILTGDLLGSGTISGPETGSQGSLLEQTNGGKSVIFVGEEQRKFLEDGDTVIIRGACGSEDEMVGFGECTGRTEPAPHLR